MKFSTDPEVTTMICVASWHDSHDPNARTRALELWMETASATSGGQLFESHRDEPGDVWSPARRIPGGWTRSEAAAMATSRALRSLVEYPDAESGEAGEPPELEPAEVAAAVADGLGAQLGRDALLSLHGELVTLCRQAHADEAAEFPIVAELLTRLESGYMAARGHSVRS